MLPLLTFESKKEGKADERQVKAFFATSDLDDVSLFVIPHERRCLGVPDSVTRIGERAFYGCENLTVMTIPAGVTEIGADAFSEVPGEAA